MKKSLSVITCFLLVIVVSFAFKKPPQVRFENLKVLPKNTNKQQMDSVMHFFSASLGVRCTYCHVRGNDEQKNFDFASDENKNKGIARSMMRMTTKINKKYFREHQDDNMIAAVTCYSCHHGQEEPATKAPPPPPRQSSSQSH